MEKEITKLFDCHDDMLHTGCLLSYTSQEMVNHFAICGIQVDQERLEELEIEESIVLSEDSKITRIDETKRSR